MSSRLDRIKDWTLLAKSARYFTAELARSCDVSPRQLERFFRSKMNRPPHAWLRQLRMRRALELIRDGAAMKEVALELCYKDSAHFTHDFKNYYGLTPSQSARQTIGLPADVAFQQQMSHFNKRCPFHST